MSLKVFHVVFIVLAVLLTFGFAAWALMADNVGTLSRVAGVSSAVLGVALAVYGFWFVTRKARRLNT